jgi:C-methyltransferase./Hypothetical methyltransferase.
VLDLGRQPSCELFPKADVPGPDPTFPLRMWLCARCGLAQLADDANVDEEPIGHEPAALQAQRRDAVARLIDTHVLPAAGTVVEFPSPHGGSWRPLLAEHGFTDARPGEPADVVVDGCFGIMHEPDQRTALRCRVRALRPGGVFVVQYHGLDAIVAGTQWNALRLGHYAYYSTPAMVGMVEQGGLTVTSAHRFPLYGGTVLLTAAQGRHVDKASVESVLAAEQANGIQRPEVVGGLQDSVRPTAHRLRETLEQHRAQGRRVYGYSAASRAVALLCLAEVDVSLLCGIADASPDKQTRRMPGTDIPIISPRELVAAAPDVVLVFVPDLLDEVRAALPQIEAAGGRWTTV